MEWEITSMFGVNKMRTLLFLGFEIMYPFITPKIRRCIYSRNKQIISFALIPILGLVMHVPYKLYFFFSALCIMECTLTASVWSRSSTSVCVQAPHRMACSCLVPTAAPAIYSSASPSMHAAAPCTAPWDRGSWKWFSQACRNFSRIIWCSAMEQRIEVWTGFYHRMGRW